MKNISDFSFRRMMSLTGKIVMEQPKMFLMRMLLLFGSLSIGAVFIGMVHWENYRFDRCTNDPAIDGEQVFFMMALFVIGCVYTSMAFNESRNKAGRISTLMLPARYAEKYMARFIIYIPVYIVMFVIAMWFADAMRVLAVSIFNTDALPSRIHFLTIEEDDYSEVSHILACFLIVQSFYWLGAILWPRNSLIKSFAAMSVLGALYTAVTPLLFYLIIGPHNNICGVPWLEKLNPGEDSVMWAIAAVICTVNYTLAYMRLKESEVIQRLL